MKVKLLMAINLEGRNYEKGDTPNLKPKDAQALIRGKYAIGVKERAINHTQVETRVID